MKKIITLGAGTLAVCGAVQAAKQKPAKGDARPNFIIILADDMGYGDLGCYGNTTIKTPNLDRMAAEGMRLVDFHANGSVSTPTRAALLTGRYQQRAGLEGVILENVPEHADKGLQPGEVTFAKVLSDNGYATGLVGKWHLGTLEKYHPLNFGFGSFTGFVGGHLDYFSHMTITGEHDWWVGREEKHVEGYLTDMINSAAVDFIRKNKESPFCLYVAHNCPHSPLIGPNDYALRKPGGTRPFPQLIKGRNKEDIYREMIECMDRGIGDIFTTLKESGVDSHTLVLFFSDNGPQLRHAGSSGPLREGKSSPFEGGHRAPTIARMPDMIVPGSICNSTAIGMDIFPTMCDMAGIKIPSNLDGVSIAPLLRGKQIAPRILFYAMGPKKAVREGKWKLVVIGAQVREKGKEPRVEWATTLYDLDADLGEQNDLAAMHPDLVTRLQDKLAAWEKEVRNDVPEQLTTYIRSLSFGND